MAASNKPTTIARAQGARCPGTARSSFADVKEWAEPPCGRGAKVNHGGREGGRSERGRQSARGRLAAETEPARTARDGVRDGVRDGGGVRLATVGDSWAGDAAGVGVAASVAVALAGSDTVAAAVSA